MNELRAILWLDWRLVRRDFLVLFGLALAGPPVLGLLAPTRGALGVLAWVFLPCSATLLGSTLAAGDAALPFLRARPTGWTGLVALRLLHRGLLAAAVAVGGLLSTLALTPDRVFLIDLASDPAFSMPAIIFAALGLASAGGLASAHAREPLLCVFVGWVLYLFVGFGAFALLSWGGEQWFGHDARREERLLHALPVLLGLLWFSWATWALRRRTATTTPSPWRTVAPALALALLVPAVVVLPQLWQAAQSIEEMEQVWRRAGALPESGDRLVANHVADEQAAMALLATRAEWDGWGGRDGVSSRLGSALQALQAIEREAGTPDAVATERLETLLEPVRAPLELVEALAIDGALSPSERAGLAALTSSAPPLLVARARLFSRSGDASGAARAALAAWRLQEPLLPNPRWPYWHPGTLDRFGELLDSLRLGLPAGRELREELAALELRDRVAFAIAVNARTWTLPPRWVLHPRRAQAEAESFRHLAELATRSGEGAACGRFVFDDRVVETLQVQLGRQNRAVALDLETELTLRVLDRRAGRQFEPVSFCPDARWRLDEQPDGSWSIVLENGPIDLRHDEPPPDSRVE